MKASFFVVQYCKKKTLPRGRSGWRIAIVYPKGLMVVILQHAFEWGREATDHHRSSWWKVPVCIHIRETYHKIALCRTPAFGLWNLIRPWIVMFRSAKEDL
jgi:hypothetical protein